MQIFVFGNKDHYTDKKAFEVAKKLQQEFSEVNFEEIKPNQDLPIEDNNNAETLIMLDTVMGIEKPTLFDETNIDNIIPPSSSTVHDYDLGFQLKYLKKLGKIKKFYIVGIPLEKELTETDYSFIHSTVKKLVAQDIQGS